MCNLSTCFMIVMIKRKKDIENFANHFIFRYWSWLEIDLGKLVATGISVIYCKLHVKVEGPYWKLSSTQQCFRWFDLSLFIGLRFRKGGFERDGNRKWIGDGIGDNKFLLAIKLHQRKYYLWRIMTINFVFDRRPDDLRRWTQCCDRRGKFTIFFGFWL